MGYRAGLVGERDYGVFSEKRSAIEKTLSRISETKIHPTRENNEKLHQLGSVDLKKDASLREILKRPEIHFPHLIDFDPSLRDLPAEVREQIEVEVKYDGYARRQQELIERFQKLEALRFPEDFDFGSLAGLTTEVKEKLVKIRPISLGQASRISGVTPAAISILMVNLKKQGYL
jgi:tRNA uridine 5-carboxymethylaminomethyl modification enzyme